jgi:hypothetical protein
METRLAMVLAGGLDAVSVTALCAVLRGVDEGPPRTPVAGLARLEDLLAENRSAGPPVELEAVNMVWRACDH